MTLDNFKDRMVRKVKYADANVYYAEALIVIKNQGYQTR